MTGMPDSMAKLAEAAALQGRMGMTDIHVLDHEPIREVVPWIATPGVLGATYTPNDGKVTPTDGVAALVKAARSRGVRFREHWAARSLERVGPARRVIGPEVVEAERVVVCIGYWATDFLRSFGLELSIRPQALYSAITGPALAGQPVPLTLDLDTGFVVEREGAGLIIAILFEDNPPGYGHTRMLEEFAELARVRAPSLAELHIARRVVANVDMGGDGHPYVGVVEHGVWVAAGFGGHGVMHGPPVAELLAKTIAGRPDPTVDITPLTPWRKGGAASEWMVAA